MKYFYFLIIFFLFFVSFSFSQNPLVKKWDMRFGGISSEELFSFKQTNDGGYILGGTSLSGIGGDKTQPNWDTSLFNITPDYWVVKIDGSGTKEWDKRFGGRSVDALYSLCQTSDGGYILGGDSRFGIGGDKTQANWDTSFFGTLDYWIVKIDSIGNKEWDKRYGGIANDQLRSLQQTNDGGYILGGYSESDISGDKSQPSRGGLDYWIVKTDSLGNKLWDKRFGGNDNDIFSCLQQTKDNGYILGGYSFSGINGDKTQANWDATFISADFWIVKIDSNGAKQWDKRYGGSNYDEMSTMKQTSDGGYILGGESGSQINGDKTQPTCSGTNFDGDYWIVKIDSIGNKQWDWDFGGTSSDELYSLQQTSDGGYLLGGNSFSFSSCSKTEGSDNTYYSWVVKTDSLGIKKWDKTIFTVAGLSGHGIDWSSAIQTKDGCYTIANSSEAGIGGYKTQQSWGGMDYWVVKFCDSTQTPLANFATQDFNFCAGTCINFTNYSSNSTAFQWFFPGAIPFADTSANPQNICYNSSGNYDVTLVAKNSTGIDTLTMNNFINVNSLPSSFTVSQNIDTLFAPQGFSSYQWYSDSIINGATNYFYITNLKRTYFVKVKDNFGCENNSLIYYYDLPCDLDIKIPNVFTPNNDEINDTYHIDNLCTGENFSFVVYNRWGTIVFETGDKNFSWNGKTTKNIEVPASIYYFLLTIGLKDHHGFIELIRN